MLIRKLGLNDKSPLAATLYGAIVGYYARPFTSSNNLGKLPDSIVPKEYEQYHRDAIQFRNQVFLHTDGNAQAPGKSDINRLRFTRCSDNDPLLIHNIVPIPKEKTLLAFCNLLDFLIVEINTAINDYIKHQVPDMQLAPGTYVLKLDGDGTDLQIEK